jgi:predicted GNAT family acetyltransferase
LTVRHDVENSRFVIPVGQGEAELVYRLIGDSTIDLQHTEVPKSDRGRGVADTLVRAAVKHARENRLRVIPSCPYVKAWFERHPEEDATGHYS